MRNKKMIIIIPTIVIIICAILGCLFYLLFLYDCSKNNIELIDYINNKNRADFLSYINIVVVCISSIISIGISILVYNLSKEIEKKSIKEEQRERYKCICTIFDYLNEIIAYTKRKVFAEKENYDVIDFRDDFIEKAYLLNNDIFNENDIEYLRQLNKSLKNYVRNLDLANQPKDPRLLSIKWLYKYVFDVCIPINKIDDINLAKEEDIILNPRLLTILYKLERVLNNKLTYAEYTYDRIKLKIKHYQNAFDIVKTYDESHRIINGNGKVIIYEPIFYSDNTHKDGGIIFDGEIENYKCQGFGKYYYHSSNISGVLNSNDLADKNAQKITKELENNNVKTNIEVYFDGSFKQGLIDKGIIFYRDGNEEKTIEI